MLLIGIAATGLLVIAAASAHLVSTTQLVTVPTALFLTVYLGCTAAASRVLRGPARVAAAGALAAVAVIMVFSGWAAVLAVLTAGTAAALYRPRPASPGPVREARPGRQASRGAGGGQGQRSLVGVTNRLVSRTNWFVTPTTWFVPPVI